MARRVLVVDDEREIRTVLRVHLETEGDVGAEAATGAEAPRRALETDGRAPDVVLLDIAVPDPGSGAVFTVRLPSAGARH